MEGEGLLMPALSRSLGADCVDNDLRVASDVSLEQWRLAL
jgi:hypothetical protein